MAPTRMKTVGNVRSPVVNRIAAIPNCTILSSQQSSIPSRMWPSSLLIQSVQRFDDVPSSGRNSYPAGGAHKSYHPSRQGNSFGRVLSAGFPEIKIQGNHVGKLADAEIDEASKKKTGNRNPLIKEYPEKELSDRNDE